MPYMHKKYYYDEKNMPVSEKKIINGMDELSRHLLFGCLNGDVYMKSKGMAGKGSMATVDRKGNIYLNCTAMAEPKEWAYSIAHCLLHLAFGHFDKDNMPEDEELNKELWNKACDIYIAQFLADTDFGKTTVPDPKKKYKIKLTDEIKIYQQLIYECDNGEVQEYGTNGQAMDMIGLEHPIVYGPKERNNYTSAFAFHLARSAREAVNEVSENKKDLDRETEAQRAAQWFLAHYPLLGGLASGFKLIEDIDICRIKEIQVAAVDAYSGEIYLNPTAGLNFEELKFVLAHEYLHAGLDHAGRCQGRDKYLWNIACDYVINGWLHEMNIGEIPEIGVLYDESLRGMSAESVYDLIIGKMRKFSKHATFRGYGKGDIISDRKATFKDMGRAVGLDEFFKNALKDGLDFTEEAQRGLIPAGLIEEIRALSAKPIPWDVELAKLFSEWFPALEKQRSYARASRRQGSTPDIARPGYIIRDEDKDSRTFGVIVDTSGSMSAEMIGYALGAIASYAISKDVEAVRVVFCDAAAYDIGAKVKHFFLWYGKQFFLSTVRRFFSLR